MYDFIETVVNKYFLLLLYELRLGFVLYEETCQKWGGGGAKKSDRPIQAVNNMVSDRPIQAVEPTVTLLVWFKR